MKLLMENWRKYQKELLNENLPSNVQTYGQLVQWMKTVRSKERGRAGLQAIADEVLSPDIPGKGLVMHLYKTYINKEPPEPQDVIKLFGVDPEIAKIVDNDVEEAFVQKFLMAMENPNSAVANIRLDDPNWTMNKTFRDWLANNYQGRTVKKL